MSIKLQNRRDVESQLQKFLDKMVLPPDMVSTLTGKEVNDAYIGKRHGEPRLSAVLVAPSLTD